MIPTNTECLRALLEERVLGGLGGLLGAVCSSQPESICSQPMQDLRGKCTYKGRGRAWSFPW
jgi:hypothetical protein